MTNTKCCSFFCDLVKRGIILPFWAGDWLINMEFIYNVFKLDGSHQFFIAIYSKFIMNKYTCLSKELLSVGQSLGSIGILEMVWKSQDALKVIDFLTDKGY